ncbi:unnamed protein product [Peronospora destructor]|uniref:Uncharacterized protein n=1 Tax=Peronospora destructor TaxID=86335 RepID=A0AAV0VBT2_9STRA|nr:unnamed protein product [Peronospora destructor]
MWQLLEQVTENAPVNTSSYVNFVYEKAQTLVTAVQDEASTLLSSAMGSARYGPVDEILSRLSSTSMHGQKQTMMDNNKAQEDNSDEDSSKEDALDGDYEHRPAVQTATSGKGRQ